MVTGLRQALDSSEDANTTYYLRNNLTVTIVRRLAIDPAPIPLADRFRLAKSKLTEIRRSLLIRDLEERLVADLDDDPAALKSTQAQQTTADPTPEAEAVAPPKDANDTDGEKKDEGP